MPLTANQLWRTQIVGMIIFLVTGVVYTFGDYSVLLKQRLSLLQDNVNLLNSLESLGIFLAIPVGLLHSRFGCRVTLGVGALMFPVSFVLTWAIARELMSQNMGLLATVFFIMGLGGCTAANTFSVISQSNFPAHQRSRALAALLACFALSPSLWVAFYKGMGWDHAASIDDLHRANEVLLSKDWIHGVFMGDFTDFLMVAALAGLVTYTIGAFIIREEGKDTLSEKAMGEMLGGFNSGDEFSDGDAMDTSDEYGVLLEGSTSASEPVVVDKTGMALARDPNFWMLFFSFFGLSGTSLTLLSNLGALSHSLGFDTISALLVVTWSISNTLGRMGTGIVVDATRGKVSKPSFIVLSGVLTIAGFASVILGIATNTSGLLFFGTGVVAVAYSTIWIVAPGMLPELFGGKHMAMNFGYCAMAPSISSLVVNWIVGKMYTVQAHDEITCSGAHCYLGGFILCAAVSTIALFVALFFRFHFNRAANDFVPLLNAV